MATTDFDYKFNCEYYMLQPDCGAVNEMDVEVKRGMLKTITVVFVWTIIFALILFGGSGRLDWIMAWVYIAMLLMGSLASPFLLDPELLAERSGIKQGTKKWDIFLAIFMGRVGPLLTLIVAALDKRFLWSPSFPFYIELSFALAAVLAYAFVLWAMAANKFFAPVVRIQQERGHTAVTAGPYKFVRHPGYAGSILFVIATAVMLGSLWALVPAGLTVIVTVVRTALEDKTLQSELQGYREYAASVRFRLLPGVW